MGDAKMIQYLVDAGADLGAYDLGKKNDGAFGASVEPLMPIDYAIGVWNVPSRTTPSSSTTTRSC